MAKHDTTGRGWKAKFLAVYTETGDVSLAAEAAKVNRTTPYEARNRDQDFRVAMEAIKVDWAEKIRDAGVQRALGGSDRLIEFFLRNWQPAEYGDNVKVIHTGTVEHKHETVFDAEVAGLVEKMREAAAQDVERV